MKSQRRLTARTCALGSLVTLAIITGTGCGTKGGDTQESQAETTAAPATTLTPTTSETPPSTAAPATTAAPTTTAAPVTTTAPPTTAAPAGYTMPDLVGQNLQDAQDELQSVSGNPLFYSASHDLAGSRNQVLDSNWKVCTQNIPAGSTFTDDTTVDFGVVKLDEICP